MSRIRFFFLLVHPFDVISPEPEFVDELKRQGFGSLALHWVLNDLEKRYHPGTPVTFIPSKDFPGFLERLGVKTELVRNMDHITKNQMLGVKLSAFHEAVKAPIKRRGWL